METLTAERQILMEIPGIVPPLGQFGADRCLFATRCGLADAPCADARPGDVDFAGNQRSACWHAEAV